MNRPRLPGIAALAAASLIALIGGAAAQLLPPGNVPGGRPPGVNQPPPPPGGQVAPQQVNPNSATCVRLESALAQLNSGASASPEQVSRYEEAIARQRTELDQSLMQARRIGCDQGNGFFLFGSLTRPAQCDRLNQQIGSMRANLDRMLVELGQMRGGSSLNRDLQRRQLIGALADNNCGPQYRSAAIQQQPRTRSLFETIFGGLREETTIEASPLDIPQSGTFRTICVRTCDGFYFPISFATVQSKFQDDERTCKRLCPAADVALYAHRNPGEEVDQAVSLGGRLYTELPTAFQYRKEYNPSCSCRWAGQSWAEALGVGRDATYQQGDIIVTEERAKQMSLPKLPGTPQAKGKGPASVVPPATQDPAQTPAAEQPKPAQTLLQPGERRVRVVGPQFYPVR
jgi:hypothetical protein